MTIKITRWGPDTCACVVEFSWDDTLPEDQRTHTLSKVVQKCPAHAAQTDLNIYAALTEENPRKNIALQNVLDNGPAALFDLTPEGGKILKNNIAFNFAWSGTAPNRVLTISFSGINLTAQQKSAAQTLLNNKFGAGKVTLV